MQQEHHDGIRHWRTFRQSVGGRLAVCTALILGLGCEANPKAGSPPPAVAYADAGHGPDGVRFGRFEVAVDVSLSMRGFFSESATGGLQAFLDVLREGVYGAQRGKAKLEAWAITGKGVEPWGTYDPTDPQSFLQSLKRAEHYDAKNNDLVAAVRALSSRLVNADDCGLLVTDLIQSVKGDGTDATGLGLAMAEWGKSHGLAVVRFDLPFHGSYYPEAPLGGAFPLHAAGRPIYLLVMGPSPAASGAFARRLRELWTQHGQGEGEVGIADLTPDLSTRLVLRGKLPERGSAGFALAPEGPGHVLGLIRSGNVSETEVQATLGENRGALSPEEGRAWRKALETRPVSTLLTPGSPATLKMTGQGQTFVFSYDADRAFKYHKAPDLFALRWTVGAGEVALPPWVDERSRAQDRPQDVLPKGSTKAMTLNLGAILHTAQRNIGDMKLATVYFKVARP